MKKIYLDFDGVIANSAPECISSSLNVFLKMQHTSKLRSNYDDNEIEKIIKIGIQNRFLVIPPENYYCLIDAIIDLEIKESTDYSHKAIYLNEIFQKKVAETDANTLKIFKTKLFEYRDHKFKLGTSHDWFKENPPTFFLENLFKRFSENRPNMLIISRKNNSSIERWISGSNYSFDSFIGNESLVKYDNCKFKCITHLQKISNYEPAIFIDDMVFEIDSYDWSDINVKPLIAGWGYNDLEDNTHQILKQIEEDAKHDLHH